MTAAETPSIIFLDALNQLSGHHDLNWLPENNPGFSRFVVSTLPGQSLNVLERRQCEFVEVLPISPAVKEVIVRKTLLLHKKPTEEIALFADACKDKATDNPLFLVLFLEELIVHSSFESLESDIEKYLTAGTVPALLDILLGRLESTFNAGMNLPLGDVFCEGAVGAVLVFIFVSYEGIMESELRDVLGSKVYDSQWIPFRFGLQHLLIEQAGSMIFAHDYIRQAVQSRYIENAKSVKADVLAHAELGK